MLEVEFDLSELTAGLERLLPENLDLEPAMQAVGEMLVRAVHDEFETEGQGDWPPLAESTLAKRGEDAVMLRDTDRWYASNQPESDDESAGVYTDVEYAVFHVSSEPRSVIPLRNPYVLRDTVIDDVAALVADYLCGVVPTPGAPTAPSGARGRA